jgi:hypothetical protein
MLRAYDSTQKINPTIVWADFTLAVIISCLAISGELGELPL